MVHFCKTNTPGLMNVFSGGSTSDSLVTAMRTSRAFEREEVAAVETYLKKCAQKQKSLENERHHCNTKLRTRKAEIEATLKAREEVLSSAENVEDAVIAILAKRHTRLAREKERIETRMNECEPSDPEQEA